MRDFILAIAIWLTGGDGFQNRTLSEQISMCWNTGGLSQEARRAKVTVLVPMTPEGKPIASGIQLSHSEGASEDAAQQAYQAARRAIIRCGASGYNLPADKYEQWKEIEMVFNPERMRIK